MGANTEFKNSVFCSLFSGDNDLRDLYGVFGGVTLPPDIPIELNTLSGTLYMGHINDISFTIGSRLVIVLEHQSTINPNMPLRLLMYIGRIYEKIVNRRSLYTSTLQKIPTPEFIVLYNGTRPYPDQTTLKLSDAFKDAAGLREKSPDTPELELLVKVYNINKNHNAEIVKKCEKLYGYSYFVDKVRELERKLSKDEAMKRAIEHCINNNILKEFLETNSSEVFNMLTTEWNTEDAKEAWYEEGIVKGREEGREEGHEEGFEEGIEKEREATIKNLLRYGMQTDQIANVLKLPITTVEQYYAY